MLGQAAGSYGLLFTLLACKMTHEIEPLVSCRWLKEKILDKALEENVVVCDVSWSSQKDMENQYKR